MFVVQRGPMSLELFRVGCNKDRKQDETGYISNESICRAQQGIQAAPDVEAAATVVLSIVANWKRPAYAIASHQSHPPFLSFPSHRRSLAPPSHSCAYAPECPFWMIQIAKACVSASPFPVTISRLQFALIALSVSSSSEGR